VQTLPLTMNLPVALGGGSFPDNRLFELDGAGELYSVGPPDALGMDVERQVARRCTPKSV